MCALFICRIFTNEITPLYKIILLLVNPSPFIDRISRNIDKLALYPAHVFYIDFHKLLHLLRFKADIGCKHKLVT